MQNDQSAHSVLISAGENANKGTNHLSMRMILKDGDIAHEEHHWESSALFKQAAGNHQEVRTVLPVSVSGGLI